MHFSLTDEEEMIRETARRIAAERLAPLAEKLDRGEGRDELLANLKLLAENGFMALNVKADLRRHRSRHGRLRARGRGDSATPAPRPASRPRSRTWSARSSRRSGPRRSGGAYLPRLADGTYPAGAFCLTESGAGSDPAA